MRKDKPLLLVSNDDGVNAKGIHELVKVLRSIGNIIVVAPDGPRSGSSSAITSANPLSFNLVKQEDGLSVYKCSGTPVDCIKLALHTIVPRKPDIVIGGINHGDNSSINVHYSGTMGLVIEGCLKGIPSVGFSLCDHGLDADFSFSLPYIDKIVRVVLLKGLPVGNCLNVNFPEKTKMKGVRICRQTKALWVNEFVEREHPHGGHYYWMTGDFMDIEQDAEDTDRWALQHDYVAITPVQIDVTAYALFEELKKWDLNV